MLPGVPGGGPGSWELACFALCRLHPAAGANRLSWPSRLVAAAHGAGEEVDRGRLEPGEAGQDAGRHHPGRPRRPDQVTAHLEAPAREAAGWTKETIVLILGDARINASTGAGPGARVALIALAGDAALRDRPSV